MDFGEADFHVNGLCRRMKYLTVSFPYSNDGFTQAFGGETAGCVCQDLRNIFEYIGGVPPLLIFAKLASGPVATCMRRSCSGTSARIMGAA